MSASSGGPSTHRTQHKRKEPLQDFTTPDHFPAAFHLPSRHSVRRCLRTHPIDGVTTNEVNVSIREPFSCDASSPGTSHMPSGRSTRCRRLLEFPHPDPVTAAQSRRKRNIAMLVKLQKAHSPNQEIHRNVRPRIGPSDSCAPVSSSMCDHPNLQPTTLADRASLSNPSTIPPPCSSHHRTVFSPLRLGPPHERCRYCGAFFWYEERVRRDRHTSSPTYNTCCKEGSVILPPYRPPPQPLHDLLTGVDRPLLAHFF